MYKAPILLDPKVIDAAMQRSRELRSEAAYDIAVSVRDAVRRFLGLPRKGKNRNREAFRSAPVRHPGERKLSARTRSSGRLVLKNGSNGSVGNSITDRL